MHIYSYIHLQASAQVNISSHSLSELLHYEDLTPNYLLCLLKSTKPRFQSFHHENTLLVFVHNLIPLSTCLHRIHTF